MSESTEEPDGLGFIAVKVVLYLLGTILVVQIFKFAWPIFVWAGTLEIDGASWEIAVIAGLLGGILGSLCIIQRTLAQILAAIGEGNRRLGEIKQRVEWVNNEQERQWKKSQEDPTNEILESLHPLLRNRL